MGKKGKKRGETAKDKNNNLKKKNSERSKPSSGLGRGKGYCSVRFANSCSVRVLF